MLLHGTVVTSLWHRELGHGIAQLLFLQNVGRLDSSRRRLCGRVHAAWGFGLGNASVDPLCGWDLVIVVILVAVKIVTIVAIVMIVVALTVGMLLVIVEAAVVSYSVELGRAAGCCGSLDVSPWRAPEDH